MQRLELEVDIREVGRSNARKVRREGGVPAILYGSDLAPVNLQVVGLSLEGALRAGANSLIDLKGPKEVKGKLVLVKDVQRDPVSRQLVHCDLYAVDTKKKIHVDIPLHFEGKPPGVEEGGILDIVVRELEVSCLPLAIPDRIDVDVSTLNIGDAVHLSEIALPEGVEALIPQTQTLVHVAAPRVEEEAAPAEGEGVEGEEGAPAEGAAPAEGEGDKAGEKSGEKASG